MDGIKASLAEIWNRWKRMKTKVVPNRIFFHNIWGKYSDNTRALAEEYHRVHPDWEIIYEIGNGVETSVIPEYITTTTSGTDECLNLMYSSRVVVDNDWGVIKRSGIGIRGRIICFLYKSVISSKTLYVSTGHGTPLKKIGCDAISDRSDRFVTSTQLMGVLDNHSKSVYQRITMGNVKEIVVTGSPRNDYLFDAAYGEDIRKQLGLVGKRLLLFAPTFRTRIVDGKVQFVGVEDLLKNINDYSVDILNALHERMGGDWVLGLRVHPGAASNFGDVFNERIIDANKLTDMADYLCITDILLTDYSSCLFDFMLTKRPCIMLWADEKEYSTNERGMYFKEAELPYPVARDFSEVISCLKSMNESDMHRSVEAFTQKYGFSDNHHAGETLIQYIDQRLT